MDRTILHADLNNFYASVECLYNPKIRDKPVVVGGSPEARHGIVLAKNMIAKVTGVKTGEALWEAKQKCPGLIVVPPNFELYMKFSKMAKAIFKQYSPLVESYGADEAWIDVTGCDGLFGEGKEIADTIRARIKRELGLTASVGVSYNKIYAKLGSDYKSRTQPP
jgi:DNA polymerase-4